MWQGSSKISVLSHSEPSLIDINGAMLGLANPGISSGLSFGRSRSQITFEKFCEKKIIAKKKIFNSGSEVDILGGSCS